MVSVPCYDDAGRAALGRRPVSPTTLRAISNVMCRRQPAHVPPSISASRSSAGTATTKSAAERAGRASPPSAGGVDEIVPPNDSTVTCGRRPNTAPVTVELAFPGGH